MSPQDSNGGPHRPPEDAPPGAWRIYAAELESRVAASERRANFLQHQLNAVTGSAAWRWARSARNIVHGVLLAPFPRARKLVTAFAKGGTSGVVRLLKERALPDQRYDLFLKKNELTDAARAELTNALNALSVEQRPLISVLMPVYNTPAELLRAAVDSVRQQIYPNWELCVVDDKSPEPHVRPLLEELAKGDARIRVKYRAENGNISRATQDALELAGGKFIALLDHDDVITPDALARVALELAAHPDADLVYSDRDMLEMSGRRTMPYFKPDWSPDMFLSNMYVCHLGVLRTELVRKVGGFRVGFEGSQDYDLVLRLTEQSAPEKIRHIPRVLYSWRRVPGSTAQRYAAKSYADAAARKALGEALQRRGIDGTVESGNIPSLFRIRRAIKGNPLVSIIIPFRDKPEYLARCLQSLREKTSYRNFEFILADNGSTDRETLALLDRERREPNVTVLRVDEPFNFSRLNNLAAAQAKGEHLLLLNNDVEIIESDWLNAMLEHSQRPEVGAVGAKLLYPDGLIQHAGVVLGIGEVAGHAFRFLRDDDHGYYGSAIMIRNYSAVTAACLMTRKSVYQELGGLNEKDLAVAYNDVDFCLRLREKGYLVVYTPYAKVRHHESVSRGLTNNPRESAYMCRRWPQAMRDPYYNPNLSTVDEDFSLPAS